MRAMDRPPATMALDGWQTLPAGPHTGALIAACVEATEDLLGQAIDRSRSRLGKRPNLDRPYRSADQIAKSAVRGLFRIDPRSRSLATSSARELRRLFGDDGAKFYMAPPYAYVHLPDDLVAANDMHRDDYEQEKSEFFVSWTPLNSCDHGPIELVPRTHRGYSLNRLRWALHLRGLPTWISPRPSITPHPTIGESLSWAAKTYHAGTLNQSTTTHVALNTKIRDRLIPYEPNRVLAKTVEPAEATRISMSGSEHTDALIDLIEALDDLVYSEPTLLDQPTDLFHAVKSLLGSVVPEHASHAGLSFSLTIAGMRMPDMDPVSPAWNFAATLLAPEYLWSFERLLHWVQRTNPSQLETVARLVLDQHPFQQVALVIHDSTDIRLPRNLISGLPVADWST